MKKNLTNLYGTLTRPFTAKECFVFKNDELFERYVEIPEKSLKEVTNAIEKSKQFIKLENKIFSTNYFTEYKVYLNADKIVTVKAISTFINKYSNLIQSKIDSAQFTVSPSGTEVSPPNLKEEKIEPVIMTTIDKTAEYVGGQTALSKFINSKLEIPADAEDFTGKVIVRFTVEKDGSLSNINVEAVPKANKVPASLVETIKQLFLSMPKWKAALDKEGRAVRSMSSLPLNF